MASTYSTSLRLELIGTGEQQGSWGTTTNTNLGTLLEQAIGGFESVTVSNVADTTLTTNNGALDQARNMVLNLSGTISATRNVIVPSVEKLYVIKNGTTGGFAVTVKVSGQTGVSIPNGSTYVLYVDGTDVRQVTGSLANQLASSVTITGGTISGITDLAVADGGTGASDASGARTNLGLVIGTNVQAYDADLSAIAAISDSSTGFLQKTGANTWSLGSAQAFASGTLMLFQQTAAPTGWTKETTHNNKALRVVTGTASSGGSTVFSSVFTSSRTPAGSIDSVTVTGSVGSTTATGTVGNTTLTTSQMPGHTHNVKAINGTYQGTSSNAAGPGNNNTASSSAGGDGAHNHSLAMDAHSHSLSMNSHGHTFTGSGMDFDVQYVDLIIAKKD